MNKKMIFGITVLVVVAIIVLFIGLVAPKESDEIEPQAHVITIYGATGGGKENFLADEEIAEILQEEYGIQVVHKSVSNSWLVDETRLVEDTEYQYDFMFCSDQRYYEQYQAADNKVYQKSKGYIALNTPIVIYSWEQVAEVLMADGIVTKTDEKYYLSDPVKLLTHIEEQTTWKDICGDPQNPVFKNNNPINILSVDPVKSSPGMTYYGWVARVLDAENRTGNITEGTLQKLQELYKYSGFLGFTPSDLFDQYLRIGMGTYPLIVDYEKSLIDWAIANPAAYETVKNRIVVLYPEPIMWNSHCILSFTESGDIFVDALEKNARIQEIAFKRYGFRMGISTAYEDTTSFPTETGDVTISGIPNEIYSAVMPIHTDGYNRIMEALRNVE